jgi:hypothetical protein
MHLRPYHFVKIRYYGILGSRQKKTIKPLMVRNKKPRKQRPKRSKQGWNGSSGSLASIRAGVRSAKKEPCTPSRLCQGSGHFPYSFQTQKPLVDSLYQMPAVKRARVLLSEKNLKNENQGMGVFSARIVLKNNLPSKLPASLQSQENNKNSQQSA